MNDTISSLKRVPSFGQTKSITHPCFFCFPTVSQAKENYYKLHKGSDQANMAYTSKKSDSAIKAKELDKVW